MHKKFVLIQSTSFQIFNFNSSIFFNFICFCTGFFFLIYAETIPCGIEVGIFVQNTLIASEIKRGRKRAGFNTLTGVTFLFSIKKLKKD